MTSADILPSTAVPISAKLSLPLPRAGAVERSSLVARLEAAPPGAVITIAGPAGYGKTTLLVQWAARQPRLAYLRLDAADDDARRLLAAIAAAIGRLEPLPEAFLRQVERPGGVIETGVVAQLLEALWAPGEPFVLALDDVHELTSVESTDILAMLAGNLPPRVRLVLASRTQPRLPLARLAVEGRLLRIGPDALALDAADVRRMATALGQPVDGEAAEAVLARTEGWPAATYLALHAAGAGEDPPRIAGTQPEIADYLRQELLDPLPQPDRAWLRRASVLDTLSGPLADAVLLTTGSLARLRTLEQRNLFIVPLDPGRTTFKFHQLFRELLRDELDEVEPGEAVALLRRAAERCIADGADEDAASYALRSGDLDLLASILGRYLVPTFWRGRWTTLLRLVEPFDRPGMRERHAALAVLASWLHTFQGQWHEAIRWLRAAEQSPDDRPMPDGTDDKEPWIASLRAQLMPNGLEGSRADSRIADAGLRSGGYFRQVAHLHVAAVALMDGDMAGCRAAAQLGLEEALARGANPGLVVLMGLAAVAAMEQRDLPAARAIMGQAIRRIEETGFEHVQVSGLTFAAAARLATLDGDRALATRHLARFDRLRPGLGRTFPYVSPLARTQALEVHLATGDMAAARTLLRETDDILRHQPDLGWIARTIERLRDRMESSGTGRGDHWSLTAAELRVLAYLPTHLSAREIAERLFVSPHTVKTQMMSIYGKLGASSRREAVEQAIEARLLDPAVIYTPPARRS
ncbi:MAG: LuxR C-terminal-related transcriptional regulator [Chloroflexota bacterium]